MALGTAGTQAQNSGEVKVFISANGSRVLGLSDNGHFAVGSAYEEGRVTYPFIWDIINNTQVYLNDSYSTGICMYGDAKDVTDDGKTIVGQVDGLPAIYHVETGKWEKLPLPSDKYTSGWANKVTPDGKYITGIALEDGELNGVPCLWENGELVETVLPEKDLFDGQVVLSCFDDISADGSLIIGRLAYNSFPFASSAFMYKPATKEFSFIAEDVMTTVDPGGWMLDNHIEDMSMSPNGERLSGVFYESVYTGDPEDYDMWAVSEYYTSFEYNVTDNVFKSFGEEYQEVALLKVDNNGILYGTTPLTMPIRSAVVVENGVRTTLEDFASEKFGVENLLEVTGFENTGTITGVSGDGNVIVAMSNMGGNNYAIVGSGVSGIEKSEMATSADAFVSNGTLYLKGEVASVKIIDVLGRVVTEVSNPSSELDMNGCNGTYLVQLSDNSGKTTVKKVIVK